MFPKCITLHRVDVKRPRIHAFPYHKLVSQSYVSLMFESPMPTLVYSRRKKWRGNSSSGSAVANFCAQEPVNSRRSGDCLYVASSDTLSRQSWSRREFLEMNVKLQTVSDPLETLDCSRGPHISKCEFANGSSGVYDHSSDDVHKTCINKETRTTGVVVVVPGCVQSL
ncbi:uncharacterized protein LOC120147075 [Hibiscus syriacus]|uniref:uncharacterized protein LOC120147075 n=1 Tax=Hibiscus syriacus TaxID=106335 RepID=UPI0019218600|nr:uncharacterized protein LOC120147075 [Hibiscus syriacus]